MRKCGLIFFLLASLWMLGSYAANNKAPIPEKQAFIFNIASYQQQLLLTWQIAPNYYLYKDRIKVSAAPPITWHIDLPQGELKYFADAKRYEVYKNNVTLAIQVPNLNESTTLSISYQGCSEDGFCYPPITKLYKLTSTMAITPIADQPQPVAVKTLLTDQQKVSSLLASNNLLATFFLFILLGLLLAFTPCVLPMVPILTSIIVGQHKVTTKKAFLLSLTYVLGMAITYAFAGVLAAKAGTSLQIWLEKPVIIVFVSLLFVLLAFSLFGFYHLQLPHRWQHRLHHLSNQLPGGSYIGVFLMGMISTLIVSPCVTAPLVGVLIFIGNSGNVVLGASALFAIGLGMGIPLLLIGMSAGKWLPKHGPWMETVKVAFGFLMLAMAVWLFSRLLTPLQAMMLWGVFLLLVAAFVGVYLPKVHKRHYLHTALGSIVAILGMFLLVTGKFMPMVANHWLYIYTNTNGTFTTVYTTAAVKEQLLLAKNNHRPVLIDFYADWCESCLRLEHYVFANEKVNTALARDNFILIRVDLSANDADSEAVLKAFAGYAPPMILFYNKLGTEIINSRIAGEISAEEFLMRLSNLRVS